MPPPVGDGPETNTIEAWPQHVTVTIPPPSPTGAASASGALPVQGPAQTQRRWIHTFRPSDAVDEPPADLVCPLSLGLMTDPVVASDGFTYDRAAITDWINRNPTSPLTRKPISQTLNPIHSILRRVREYLQKDPKNAPPADWPGFKCTIPVVAADNIRVALEKACKDVGRDLGRVTLGSVQRLVDPALWDKFARKRAGFQKHGTVNEVYLFHGPRNISNLDGIVDKGFDIKLAVGGPAGFGAYAADSLQYCLSVGKIAWTNDDKTEGKVLVCRAVLGSCALATDSKATVAPDKASSVFLRASGGHVVCVYDADQYYPEFVVTIKVEKPATSDETAALSRSTIADYQTQGFSLATDVFNPIVESKYSPHHRCSFTVDGKTQRGTVMGMKLNSAPQSTMFAVRPENGVAGVLIDARQQDIKFDDGVNTPWGPRAVIFQAPCSAKLIDVLNSSVEGLSHRNPAIAPTFLEVFKTCRRASITMFFFGGAVVHALLGDIAGIVDVDVTYGELPARLKHQLDGAGFHPVRLENNVKLVCGTGKRVMEGMPMFSCEVNDEAVLSTERVVSNDLDENLLTIDFCCNSVLFDPIANHFIDPSGAGLHDIMNKKLRIPVVHSMWDLWLNQNKRKCARYWKMRLQGFTAATVETHEFLVKTTVKLLGDEDEEDAKEGKVPPSITEAQNILKTIGGKDNRDYMATRKNALKNVLFIDVHDLHVAGKINRSAEIIWGTIERAFDEYWSLPR